jgi:CBS domain-containing protein
VITAAADPSLSEATDRMLTHDIHRLVVVDSDGRRPVAVISTVDVVVELADESSIWQT